MQLHSFLDPTSRWPMRLQRREDFDQRPLLGSERLHDPRLRERSVNMRLLRYCLRVHL